MRAQLRPSSIPLVLLLVVAGCGSVSSSSPDSGAAGSGDHAGTSGGAGTSGSAGTSGHAGTGGGAGTGGHAGTGGGAGTSGSGAAGKPGPGCVCTANYLPVCGVDGKTYGNGCDADCAGVAVAHTGECTDAGAGDASTGHACLIDSDCTFNTNVGCCGGCVAKADMVPPRMVVCGVLCPAIVPNCGCVEHVCAAKPLCAAPASPAAKVAPPADAAVACPAI